MTETSGCKHLEDLIKAEIPIIKRHIEKHKWYRMMADENEAVGDFIEKYGFIMREMWCKYICKDREECDTGKKYQKE